MKFRFRLQKALDFAHMRERRKQNQLNASQQRERILQHYLEQNRSQMRQNLGRLAADPTAPIAGILAQSIENATGDARRLEATVEEEKVAQVQIRNDLVRLAMRRKALESLKDKRHADHRVSEHRREQKIIDEVSTVGWQRNHEENGSDE